MHMRALVFQTGAWRSYLVGIVLTVVLCSVVGVHAQQASSSGESGAVPVKNPRELISGPGYYSVESAADGSAQQESQAIASAQQGPQLQKPGTSSGADNQKAPVKPVGAAAAPPESTMGVAASRPAGAVVAPGKQRRARSILIRVGLIVGAGVALGTVMALSHATPSRPQ
jgi:hypothetical protein